MGGFTIYETLRILVPGTIAAFVLDMTIRLVTGSSLSSSETSSYASLLHTIESPGVFLAISFAIGLFLYLIDLAERLRIFRGDAKHPLPSSLMEKFVVASDAGLKEEDKLHLSVSTFFLIVDAYLPDRIHKRVYFFGALFKIYTDARVLLVNSLIFGAPMSIIYSRWQEYSELKYAFSGTALFAVAVIFATLLIVVLWRFRVELVKDIDNGGEKVTGKQQVRTALIGCGRMATLQFLFGTIAVSLAVYGQGIVQWFFLVPSTIASILWFWLEVGPPRDEKDKLSGFRDIFLVKVGHISRAKDLPKFSVGFRGATDMALFLPLLVGVTMANTNGSRSGLFVFAWALVVVPAVCIMAIHKHETRMLEMYSHQAIWIKLMSSKIPKILDKREGFPGSLG